MATYLSPEEAANLKDLIASSGLTQVEVSQRLGWSENTLSAYFSRDSVTPEAATRIRNIVSLYGLKNAENEEGLVPDLSYEEFRAAVQARGLKLYAVAERLGLTPAEPSRWRKADKIPRKHHAALRKLLGLNGLNGLNGAVEQDMRNEPCGLPSDDESYWEDLEDYLEEAARFTAVWPRKQESAPWTTRLRIVDPVSKEVIRDLGSCTSADGAVHMGFVNAIEEGLEVAPGNALEIDMGYGWRRIL